MELNINEVCRELAKAYIREVKKSHELADILYEKFDIDLYNRTTEFTMIVEEILDSYIPYTVDMLLEFVSTAEVSIIDKNGDECTLSTEDELLTYLYGKEK